MEVSVNTPPLHKQLIRYSGIRDNSVVAWGATIELTVERRKFALKVVSHRFEVTHDPNERTGSCPVDVAAIHRQWKKTDYFKSSLEKLNSSEFTLDYCHAMGTQQVVLQDPVFNREGDCVCELALDANGKSPVVATWYRA